MTVRLLFHEPTRANCIPARIVLLPSLISLLPQVSWIERDYVTCPLMGGISFIPGQKSRTLTQVTWSAGSGNLHANGVHLCVNPCLNYHVNGKQSETHRWLPDSGSVQSSVSKPFLFCPSTLHFLKKKKKRTKKTIPLSLLLIALTHQVKRNHFIQHFLTDNKHFVRTQM